jgi:hypothetical protein
MLCYRRSREGNSGIILMHTVETWGTFGESMGLKSRLENHIVLVVICACVATGGVVFGISQYFHSQAIENAQQVHQLKHESLQSKLASIQRGVSGESYLDIRSLVRTPTDDSIISKSQSYFPGDRFYAMKRLEEWEYEIMAEDNYSRLLLGLKPKNFFVSSTATRGADAKLHLWRRNENFHVQTEKISNHLFPHIYLQKLSYAQLDAFSKSGAQDAIEEIKSQSQLQLNADTVDQQLNRLSNIMRDDFTGIFFYYQLAQIFELSLANADIHSKLIKNQKLGNVLYAQFLTEFDNPKVNHQPTAAFYVRNEIILISTTTDVYLIKILIPSFEPAPRSGITSDVSQWLASLKIAID